jgi:hypothetical protein
MQMHNYPKPSDPHIWKSLSFKGISKMVDILMSFHQIELFYPNLFSVFKKKPFYSLIYRKIT